MNVARFDDLTRTLTDAPSRRGLLRGLAAVCGLAVIDAANHGATAGRKNKRRKKIKRNRFGCVNVGGACRGRDSVCCSGTCQGKKPKKGKKDKSTCVAHHESTCTPADRGCSDDAPVSCNPSNPTSYCYRTTGRAGFCGNAIIPGCIPCQKDADCVNQTGQGSACIVCPACDNGETMCLPPGID